MNELDRWLDRDDDEPPPYDERAFLDGAHDVPDMTEEQQARLWRKLGPRIAAQDRRMARTRQVKQGLRWGLAAACAAGAVVLAVRLFGAQPRMSMAPRARSGDERQAVEASDSNAAPAPSGSVAAQPRGGGVERRR